jgi:RNA polymerase sigma factor (sigma-70 family)
LRHFIRGQVIDRHDTEDILQEVFYELVDASRLMTPIEQAGAWLFRVAKNRITDRFRRKRTEMAIATRNESRYEDVEHWDNLLPSVDGPEADFARNVLLEEIEQAIAELPAAQREIFIAHEVEGRSFKELAAESGIGVNTLLSRKHAAVKALRERLLSIYEDFDFGGERP